MAGEFREDESDFKKGLVRLATRKTIERMGRKSRMGSELRRGVRREISAEDVPGLVTRLIEDEFVIDEGRALVANDLATELREHFDFEGLAVVLMGSAVHGGVKTRELVGIPDINPDFDWGIIMNEIKIGADKFITIREQIRDYGNDLLGPISIRHGITPPLHGCRVINPPNLNPRP